MFATYLSLFVLIALFVLFAWLVTRAWRARNIFVKIGGVLLAGLLTVLLGILSVASIRGLVLANAPRNFPVADLQVQGTPEQVARGEEIARFLCAACHTQNGEPPLAGGKNLADDIGMPLGDIYPPNLTPAGELSGWSDGEILRAIREGAHKSGRPLAGMPVQNLKHLSDEDVQAVIAYLRSQPAVQNQTPPLRTTLLTAVLVGAGLFDFSAEPIQAPVVAPPRAATWEYGEYLVNISDCRDCHGPDLSGGRPPNPVGPNLRAVVGWTKEDFIQTMRTGVRANGDPLKPPMPWKNIGSLDDTGLTAMYEYLKALPPAED